MYDFLQESDSLQKYEVKRLILSPDRWGKYVDITALTWTMVKFDKGQKLVIPNNKKGVYSFLVQPGIANHPACSHLLYIGMTDKQSLRQRFMQYIYEKNKPKGRPLIQKMLVRWEKHLWFCYAPIDDISQISLIEDELLKAFIPPMNKDFPAEIRQAIGAWA